MAAEPEPEQLYGIPEHLRDGYQFSVEDSDQEDWTLEQLDIIKHSQLRPHQETY